MKFYLITTSHLEDRLWYRDDNDYIAGMNCVAVTAEVVGCNILSFILMSNHVHFVVEGTRESAQQFITQFKIRYSLHVRKRYGTTAFLRGNEIDIREVNIQDESLERAIAYVLMNCVAANICTHPSQYPWCSGNILFNPKAPKGKYLKQLSLRAQKRLLHTKVRMKGDMFLTEEGYVSPASFIPVPFVESLFRTPARLNYFLRNSSKAKARINGSEPVMPSFRDQSIQMGIQDLTHSLFRKNAWQVLEEKEQAEIIRQLRRRFCADIAQIARITGIPYNSIAEMLENF